MNALQGTNISPLKFAGKIFFPFSIGGICFLVLRRVSPPGKCPTSTSSTPCRSNSNTSSVAWMKAPGKSCGIFPFCQKLIRLNFNTIEDLTTFEVFCLRWHFLPTFKPSHLLCLLILEFFLDGWPFEFFFFWSGWWKTPWTLGTT